MPEELIGADLILLLLAAPTDVRDAQDELRGVTRLEKLLFLAEKEESINAEVTSGFIFEPYHFGPYSKQVYEDVDVLEQLELLKDERHYGETLDELEEVAASGGDREGVERRFYLTEEGRAVAKLLGRQHPHVMEKLSRIKNTYAGMPLARLVRYVYQNYPDYAAKSVIRERVLGRATRDG